MSAEKAGECYKNGPFIYSKKKKNPQCLETTVGHSAGHSPWNSDLGQRELSQLPEAGEQGIHEQDRWLLNPSLAPQTRQLILPPPRLWHLDSALCPPGAELGAATARLEKADRKSSSTGTSERP